jgi:GH24 family phage-related lysozyme (muramidase)
MNRFEKIASLLKESAVKLVNYTIKKGDTLRGICAQKYPGQEEAAIKYIMKINNLSKQDVASFQIGQVIKIPASKDAFVKSLKLEENQSTFASSKLLSFIKEFETLHATPINVEGGGIYTVGYGHRLDTEAERKEFRIIQNQLKASGRKNGELSPPDPIVSKWLKDDIAVAENTLKGYSLSKLNQHQFDALVSVIYNAGHLPSIREPLARGRYSEVAQAIRGFNVAGYAGLKIRREREAQMFLKGIY